MRVHHGVNSWHSHNSLDPCGLLDIASFICSCIIAVNVRQRIRKSPSATWDLNQWLQFGSDSLFCLLMREVSARLAAGFYPCVSFTTHLPVKSGSLYFLKDECPCGALVAFEWTTATLQVQAPVMIHGMGNMLEFAASHAVLRLACTFHIYTMHSFYGTVKRSSVDG